MKFMMMMHYTGDIGCAEPIHQWPPQDIHAHIQFMHELNRKLKERGELVDAQGLTGPEQAKLVRARKGGGPPITDGPFAETKEFLAGFWIIDVADEARAIAVAAMASAAPGPRGSTLSIPMELRPIGVAPKSDG
jgi:hypothetical protein